MKIAGERQLLGLGGPERTYPGKLQRQPQAQRAEMPGQFRREIGGGRPHLGFSERLDIVGARTERLQQVPEIAVIRFK
jgi:hypothetical protein